MNKAIETRLQKLEQSQPNNFQLLVSKMTDEELDAQIKELSANLEKFNCPNCTDCPTPRECEELHLEIKESESQLVMIQNQPNVKSRQDAAIPLSVV